MLWPFRRKRRRPVRPGDPDAVRRQLIEVLERNGYGAWRAASTLASLAADYRSTAVCTMRPDQAIP